jgi:glycosyltransferase involved in cell wall biosynthesis
MISLYKKWSICICHYESDDRIKSLKILTDNLLKQINENNLSEQIEVLIETDTGNLSVGQKRNILIDKSSGEYVSFIDDDDNVSEDYIKTIYEKLNSLLDIVFIKINHIVNDEFNRIIIPSKYIESVFGNMYFTKNYYHLCPHKLELAKQIYFPKISFMEDIEYSTRLDMIINNSISIEQPLYHYLDRPSKSLTR